jgi:aldose sugar dehydrogenase
MLQRRQRSAIPTFQRQEKTIRASSTILPHISPVQPTHTGLVLITFTSERIIMKKIYWCLALCIGMAANSYSQTSDLSKIESVITNLYFEGWMTGDTALVGRAMHATCHLKFYRDGQFTDISRADYLARFKPKAKEEGTSGRIMSLDITGNIASAKCELETPKAVFTDYFNLLRIEDTWYIVDKISTRRDK